MDFGDYMIFCFIALTILTSFTCFLAWLGDKLMTTKWWDKWCEYIDKLANKE